MHTVSLITNNLLKIRRKAAESKEKRNSLRPAKHSFPLESYSKDHLLSIENGQKDSSSSHYNEDDQKYLQLLQVVSTPSGRIHFDQISPDIINRLDKSQGAAPLHYASINGNLFMANYLLENGAEVDIWDREKRVTPLICSAAHGHLNTAQLFLKYKCSLNAGLITSSKGKYSALHWAVRGNHDKCVDYLLSNNACQNCPVPFSETPIHAAIIAGSPKILQMLITAHNKTTRTDYQMGTERSTPLHLAASGKYPNSLELCNILLKSGNVNVNLLNSKGKTALHEACTWFNVAVVNLLLDHSANVDAVDDLGKTPLFYVVNDDEDALHCMYSLIKANCNINHQDKCGNTALHLAGKQSFAIAVELLLVNGADFSIKAHGGISALSILRKNIPKTSALLSKAFDQAATLTNKADCSETALQEQDTMVEVNFKYVLPSTVKNVVNPEVSEENGEKSTSSCLPCITPILKCMKKDNQKQQQNMRKETSKVKCLLEEQYSSLLLHPVIYSFLELKWHKVRFFFVPTLVFKILLVLLFSSFVQVPYIITEAWVRHNLGAGQLYNVSSVSLDGNITLGGYLVQQSEEYGTGLYIVIVTMATINALMELLEIIRAPKQQLKSLHPWISVAVWIMIYVHRPETWTDTCNPYSRSLVALGMLLAWIDIWIDMSRFPIVGHSIRVFFQVLKNFFNFILPHCCLLIGFILSLSLLFHENIEFQSFTLSLAKLTRVMAGDITIASQALDTNLTANSSDAAIFHYHFVVYIYTAYVLIVAIVLMNLLIGLAVNDLQGIYKGASVDKLVKQTILLNTLETSFSGHWTRSRLLRRFFGKYINLFPIQHTSSKTITFNPYDSRDSTLSSDHKNALYNIACVNKDLHLQMDWQESSSFALRRTPHLPKKTVGNKLSSEACKNDEERMLMETIDKLRLVLLYLEGKIPKPE